MYVLVIQLVWRPNCEMVFVGENWGLIGGNSPLIGGWIVRAPVIQH